MDDRFIGDIIYERLVNTYSIDLEDFVAPRLRHTNLFEFTVAVILSQNTSDVNAWRAYSRLLEVAGEITPSKILNTSIDQIAEAIKPSGMQYQRARKIKELAGAFIERDIVGEVEKTLREKGGEEARRKLLELPGIGPKTADVVLLMWFNAPSFPVDTHITRITLRLGYVARRNYEEIRRFWMENTNPQLYLPLHLLLITHGRKTCKARKPDCINCVIRNHCSYGASSK